MVEAERSGPEELTLWLLHPSLLEFCVFCLRWQQEKGVQVLCLDWLVTCFFLCCGLLCLNHLARFITGVLGVKNPFSGPPSGEPFTHAERCLDWALVSSIPYSNLRDISPFTRRGPWGLGPRLRWDEVSSPPPCRCPGHPTPM